MISQSISYNNTQSLDVIDDWITIERKPKKNKQNHKQNNKSKIKLIQSEVLDKLKYLQKYDPLDVFLVGSTARNQHREDSDIDVMIIWKRSQWNDIIEQDIDNQIKRELEQIFNRKVDLASMVYQGKLTIDTDIETITHNNLLYVNNVLPDAIPVIGHTGDIVLSKYGRKAK